jgi:hypothetical protein
MRSDMLRTDSVARRLSVVATAEADVSTVVEPLFHEYGEWVAAHLEQDAGITFTEADLATTTRSAASSRGCSGRAGGSSSPASTTSRSASAR